MIEKKTVENLRTAANVNKIYQCIAASETKMCFISADTVVFRSIQMIPNCE